MGRFYKLSARFLQHYKGLGPVLFAHYLVFRRQYHPRRFDVPHATYTPTNAHAPSLSPPRPRRRHGSRRNATSTLAPPSHTIPLWLTAISINLEARGGQNTQVVVAHLRVHALWDPASPWGDMERTEGNSTPPLASKIHKETAQPRRRRQAALRRFLATSAMIGCKYVPDLDGVHPQGVH